MARKRIVLGLISISIAACGIKVSSSESTPRSGVEDVPGSIAFIGIDGNISIVESMQDEPYRITSDANNSPESADGRITYREPTWSPSGDHLAFVRRNTLPDGNTEFRLDMFQPSTQSSFTLFSSDSYYPFYLYFAPDGESLGFLTTGDGADLNLWIANLDGRAEILDQGSPYYWTWLADGERMLIHRGGSIEDAPEDARLQILGFKSPKEVDVKISPLDFQAPDFMMATDQILVYGRQQSGMDGIYLISAEGAVLRRLIEQTGHIAFETSPSGRYLAVLSSAESESTLIGSLRVIDLLDPSRPRELPKVDDRVAAFWWSPTDDRLLYLEPFVVLDDKTQPISFNDQSETSFRFRALLYDPERTSTQPLLTFSPTQEFIRVLPFFDQYQRSSTMWSPDGNHIVYPSLVNNRDPGIYVLAVADDSPPIRIGDGILAYWSFR